MKQKLFLTLALLMTVCSFGMAQSKQAYAVYNNGTLTFYYDNQRSSRTGDKYSMNVPGSYPGWYSAHRNDIEKVEFMPSFKDARPVSTYFWFAAGVDDEWNNASKLTTITDIQYLNTSNVIDMSYMFLDCVLLKTIDVTGFKTDNVTNMLSMFDGCESLTTLDVSKFKTDNVTNMIRMFSGCSSLEELDVSNWNTEKVTNMNSLFSYCSSLTTLDVSKWNTANVEDMSWVFEGCQELTSLDVSKWKTDNVTDMSGLFFECYQLVSLDVSKWNTAKVTSMASMFDNTSKLTSLDLSSFDTRNVTNMSYMFLYDENLTTIYVGNLWSTRNLSSTNTWNSENGWEDMFYLCNKLVGGEGTDYDYEHVGKEYAIIDGGSTNPGYLSARKYDLKIAGEQVTSVNNNDILGNGVFAYYPTSNTLTVNGNYYNYNDEDIIRNNIDGLIIDVVQDATLTEYLYSSGCPIWLDAPATISGNAELVLKGSQSNAGLYLFDGASVTIDRMNSVKIEGMWGVSGPWSQHYKGEKLIVKYSNISIATQENANESAAICDLSGGIVLQGCSITAPAGAYISGNGVYSSGGSLAKKVTITAEEGISTGLEAIDNGQLTIDNSSDSWFTIDGRKLNGMPAKKGMYIHNGKKAVVH